MTTKQSTFDILTKLFRRPLKLQTFSLLLNKAQQNILATHKTTQEKIKTPHRTKKLKFPAAHFAYLVLPNTNTKPFAKPNMQNFPTARNQNHNLFYICPL
jgi:hypothetical protein